MKEIQSYNADMMLYVHIPFCMKKCNYCDFVSFGAGSENYDLYVSSLLKEIEFYSGIYKNRNVSSIFVGGGTPSIVPPRLMQSIFEKLYKEFNVLNNAEITIECNPGTLTEEKLVMYKNCGVNRLSIGLQSANDEELKILGRIHSYDDFLNNYKLSREIGFNNINIDIMSAIPDQTLESYESTLYKVCDLNPEHISAYSLIVEEGTPFYNQKLNLPDEDTERNMYYRTEAVLNEYGYNRYEISNYSKKGFECRHNLGYWSLRDYIGLGLNSSSCMDSVRWKNTDNLAEYNKTKFKKCDVQQLTKEDTMSEYMFLGLRKVSGISITDFTRLFSENGLIKYKDWIDKMISDNLLELSDDYLFLTQRGTDLANYVMAGFV